MHRLLGERWYYGWVVVAVTSLTLIVSAGVRSTPGILIYPLEADFGWSRATISFTVAVGLILFGLMGPFAGRLMDRVGPRRVMLLGLVLIVLSVATSAAMTTLWQFNLLWGLVNGVGTGMTASVLGATVANRWFVARRGLVLGMFGAATSAGQLAFVPLLVWLVGSPLGWRGTVLILGGIALLAIVPVLTLMENAPGEIGLRPYGATDDDAPKATTGPEPGIMRRAVRVPEFWLLAGSFFICGATSNGLIGTHFIAHSLDHGIPQNIAAGTLALMGAMNFIGTLASGVLTDRYDRRVLLACYYIFRGVSLFLLPFIPGGAGLAVFAVLFGLDYIATVPPTSALAADIFGRRHVGVVFGWIFCAHQIGAAAASYFGGLVRTTLGDYTLAFVVGGGLAVCGGLMALRIDRHKTMTAPVPAVAASAPMP